MTTRKTTTTTTELRLCTGSARLGMEPHEAPVSEFPKQPSRKDGLGVMCTERWRASVKGLREARRPAGRQVETAAASGEEADAASAGTATGTVSAGNGSRARSTVWVLDVDGQRRIVDATYSPDATGVDRDELERGVASLPFESHQD
jgi:hypothetical protein